MTDPAPRPLPAEPDFEALGRRFADILTEIVHRPERSWVTDHDLYAGVLRTLLSNQYCGFVTDRKHVERMRDEVALYQHHVETAEQRAAAAHATTERAVAEAASHLAASLRTWCNERTVPSRYRREGVELAASMLERMSRNGTALADWYAARAGNTPEKES